MNQSKDFYRSIPNLNGFKWVGFWDGFHHFTKKFELGWLQIRANETDIIDGNIQQMIKYNVSK